MSIKNSYLSKNNSSKMDRLHSFAGGTIMPIMHTRKDPFGEKFVVRLPGIKKNRSTIELENRVILVTFWLVDEEGITFNHLVAALALEPPVNIHPLEAEYKEGRLPLRMPYFGELCPLDSITVTAFHEQSGEK